MGTTPENAAWDPFPLFISYVKNRPGWSLDRLPEIHGPGGTVARVREGRIQFGRELALPDVLDDPIEVEYESPTEDKAIAYLRALDEGA